MWATVDPKNTEPLLLFLLLLSTHWWPQLQSGHTLHSSIKDVGGSRPPKHYLTSHHINK